ncbi:MAG TPA: TlpA disulfide reductase family protein [Gammaproteobacteria bacterium]|nr:TlpA disulfide reductase family protein [Gammaproteobacteria bacterium]
MIRRAGSMKPWAAACALLAAAGAAVAGMQLTGMPAPDFVLKSVSGHNVRLSEFRGEVVMLSFAATWCGDCRAQLGRLNEMQMRYRDAGVELLAVSLDQTAKQAGELAAASGASYPVLHDVGKVPVVVLVDRAGVVRNVFEGYQRGSEARYLESVQALLRE